MHGVEAQPDAMRLFLTGGTGFFGRSLLRHIAARNRDGGNSAIRVTVLARSPSEFLGRFPEFAGHAWLSFCKGDMLLGAPGFPDGGPFTHVLHAAADSTLGPKLSALHRFDQIVAGTRNCLDFAVRVGAERFLLTSSGGVYGPQPHSLERLPETYLGMPDPLVASNVYGVAKRVAEHLCALYSEQYGLETVVARCFAFVGPDLPLDVHFAIGNFIRDALYEPEVTVAGNGTPVRSCRLADGAAGARQIVPGVQRRLGRGDQHS
jgi:UDP-glucuronate decarboxylase